MASPPTTDTVSRVIRLKPQQFIHVLDNNTGVTRLEVGPQTITLRDHEWLAQDPQAMIVVPPHHYCVVANPVICESDGTPQRDAYGQVRLRHGDMDMRFAQEPFPLYPGEHLIDRVLPLRMVEKNSALRLRALRDFATDTGPRHAGDEWLFEGPGTYIPRIEVDVVEQIEATIIKPNQALWLQARQACTDRQGILRKDGEEWLVRDEGAYLPGVDEEVLGLINAVVLTELKALHLRARRTFTDIRNHERKAGEEWLVTLDDAETHIPDVYEDVVGEVTITSLAEREWCMVANPIGTGKRPQWGLREVRQGPRSFFLHPGEALIGGIRQTYVLGEQEALLLQALETFRDGAAERKPGDRWMIEGPTDYVPPVQVDVCERRRAIPLDKNEGIYVRDSKNGELKLVRGPRAYLLPPYEELWEKDVPPTIEELLHQRADPVADRNRSAAHPKPASGGDEATVPPRSRAVVFHVPQNAAVQIHDYKERTARVVFGPDLVMLSPDEQFTILNLSGSKPKRPKIIKALALMLGPDFMTDIIIVETADHARLQLQLSYNWYFDVDKNDASAAARLFLVPDFVGDSCKAVASRVRGSVASVRFDEFHRNSARIIRQAVFGTDENGHILDEFRFKTNGLVITNIDIQSVEPVDEDTLKSLQKSVQLAIEITTAAQEAAARHDAERIAQEARARLHRQGIVDEREAENERKKLLELHAENAAIEATGKAAAEARAAAEAERIRGEAVVQLARRDAEATRVRAEVELAHLRARQEAELAHQKEMTVLEVEKASRMAEITTAQFQQQVDAIGSDTIRAIATAGPEMQAKLLQGLGLNSMLITDGKSPVNLFSTAAGLIGMPTPPQSDEE